MNHRLPVRVVITIFVCSTVVIGHTVMTVLHVSPINPITVDLASVINAYTQPFFRQNWQLFAPEPVSQEHGLIVRAVIENEDGSEIITDYYDLTFPIIGTIHTTRLFPPRRTRLGTSIQQLLAFRDPLAERVRERQRTDVGQIDEESDHTTFEMLPLIPAEEETHQLAMKLLQGLATESAREQWGEDVTQIQVRFVTHSFPPFSKRASPDSIGEITTADSEWLPIINVG